MLIRAAIASLLCGLPLISAGAVVPQDSVSPPGGLTECSASSPTLATVTAVARALGSPAGCFVSSETVMIGEARPVQVPRDYGYAVFLKGDHDYEFSRAEFSALESTTKQQWANYKPIDGLQGKDYQEKIRSIVAEISGGTISGIKLYGPTLIGIDSVDENQYVVTTIRQRSVRIGSDDFSSTKVESTILLFKHGTIIRLGFARELKDEGDVQYVRQLSQKWAATVEALSRP